MLKWIVAALVALPLLGGVAVAGAAPARDALDDSDRARPQQTDRPETDRLDHDGEHDRQRVAGLVVGEQGQSFELRTRGGEVTVHWTPDTDCALDGEPVDCGAIEPGNALVAIGEFAGGSNEFHAQIIRARTIDRPALDRIAGIVVRDGDGALGVRTRDGEVTVLYDDGTTCRNAEGEIRCAAIAVDDRIGAVGQRSGNELAARVIVVLPHRVDRVHDRVRGVVSAAHERLLQVETRDGSWNVKFDDGTRCALHDGTAVDCGAIEARARIGAAGAVLGDHTLEAKVIVVLPVPTVDAASDLARPVRDGRS
jgi:hypothetical protein